MLKKYIGSSNLQQRSFGPCVATSTIYEYSNQYKGLSPNQTDETGHAIGQLALHKLSNSNNPSVSSFTLHAATIEQVCGHYATCKARMQGPDTYRRQYLLRHADDAVSHK